MAHNQANKPNSHTEMQSSQEAKELIIKLLPMLDKEQLIDIFVAVDHNLNLQKHKQRRSQSLYLNSRTTSY